MENTTLKPKTSLRWRMLRWGLIGLAGLITLGAVFWVEENWRGKRAWENFKHEWEAKGEKFDLKAFIPPTVPDEENFAMTPFLAPVLDFRPNRKPGESAWRERFAKLHRKLEQDQADLDVMQRELGVLDVQYYTDPVKAMQQGYSRDEINEKTDKIEARKKVVEADQQAIADAELDLRKAGGDPGWAR